MSRFCFHCDEVISEETLKQFPDTEICGECIDDLDVKSNIDICYVAKNIQTGEEREGSFDDLSNLDKRTWDLTPCIWKEPQPLCTVSVKGISGHFYEKEVFSLSDFVGIYV